MKIEFKSANKIDGTPFTLINNEDGKFMLAVGNQVVTQPKETEQECIELIEKRDWNLIGSTAAAMAYLTRKFEEHERENQNTSN